MKLALSVRFCMFLTTAMHTTKAKWGDTWALVYRLYPRHRGPADTCVCECLRPVNSRACYVGSSFSNGESVPSVVAAVPQTVRGPCAGGEAAGRSRTDSRPQTHCAPAPVCFLSGSVHGRYLPNLPLTVFERVVAASFLDGIKLSRQWIYFKYLHLLSPETKARSSDVGIFCFLFCFLLSRNVDVTCCIKT